MVIQDPVTHYWTSEVQLGSGPRDGGNKFNINIYALDEVSARRVIQAKIPVCN
jgi:hypothetical protein